MTLERYVSKHTISVTASESTTEAFKFGNEASGMVFVPTGSGLTSLTWYASDDRDADGTFLAAYDSSGTAVTQAVAAGRAYPIPEALFGAGALKIVGNTTGTVTVATKG